MRSTIDLQVPSLILQTLENALIQRFGLTVFADVMTQFSSAERFVNRAWSASADGYMNEASSCIRQAKVYLEQASKVLETAGISSASDSNSTEVGNDE